MPASFPEVERIFLAMMAVRSTHGARVATDEEAEILRLCGGDAALVAEVCSLLRHHDAIGDDDAGNSDRHVAETVAMPNDAANRDVQNSPRFLDPAELHSLRGGVGRDKHTMLDEWRVSWMGQRVGEFTLVGQRGSGAMGVVFVAEQGRPRRTVALKLIRRHAATSSLIRRFEREAQLLGRLNHPGVAQVYAAGVSNLLTVDSGSVRVPYIAMELVNGPNLLEYVQQQGCDSATVLGLIAQICDAVQHAHVRGVIHRDLKPPNILVATVPDSEPQVKVLDFGVARVSDEPTTTSGASDTAAGDQSAATALTGHGHIIGTLGYMSPEQIRSDCEVDARSDVYALGVMLYQLLSGQMPIDVGGCALPEAARRIAEREPIPLGSLNRAFRGDIETIVATALQKDPALRYQSPAELARDIRHYLAFEPIEARRDSLIYMLSKRAAQYRAAALVTAALLLIVAAAAGYARQQQRKSAAAADAAMLSQSRATTAQREAERAASRLSAELSASRIDQGRLLAAAGDIAGAERLLWDEYLARPDQRAARWALWQLYSSSGGLRTILAHPGECRTLSLARDGNRFATGGDERFVRIWSTSEGSPLQQFESGFASVRAVAFSHDSKKLAVAGDGGAAVIDVTTGKRRVLWHVGIGSSGIDFSADDSLVVAGFDDGFVRIFDANGDGIRAEVAPCKTSDTAVPPQVRGVRFDPLGRHLAASYEDGTVRLWHVKLEADAFRLTDGPPIAGRPGTTGYGVDFSPDGVLLATGSSDRTLTLWRINDGIAAATWETRNGSPRSAAFSRDGRRVAVCGFWRTQLFDVATGNLAPPPNLPALGHGGGYAAVFTPDGRLLIATGPGGTCRIWDVGSNPTTVLASTPSPVRDLSIAHVNNECFIASAQHDGAVCVRTTSLARPASHQNDANRPPWRELLRCNVGDAAQTLALHPSGKWLVVGRADGHIITIDLSSGRIMQDMAAHDEGVNLARLTPDGRTLVTCGTDDKVRIWTQLVASEGAGWKLAETLPCGGDVIGAAIRPDGKSMATTARPGVIHFWELHEGKLLGQITTSEMPWRLAYSPDGRRVAAGSWDRSVRLWDVAAKQTPPARFAGALQGHGQLVMNQAFDPTGELLGSVSNDGTLRIWDLTGLGSDEGDPLQADRRRCLLTLDARAGDALCVAYLPPGIGYGTSVAVGYYDGTVRIWDLGYFDRHIAGQVDYQRTLRNLLTDPRPNH